MNEKCNLRLDLINCKISYILTCLTSYASLDLSKRIYDINQKIFLIKKSLIDQKEYVDIRNVIELRDQLKEIIKRVENDNEVFLSGHKIACLLFEASIEIKLFNNEFEILNDFKEYLLLASQYLYYCARVVNIELLCYENKI